MKDIFNIINNNSKYIKKILILKFYLNFQNLNFYIKIINFNKFLIFKKKFIIKYIFFIKF